eukprot:CCRYP_019424-RB/>CCRYP_019424-RB protein AED:0.30 eAED:1.00 QI:0/-1/0/1/-1/0/1/0/57
MFHCRTFSGDFFVGYARNCGGIQCQTICGCKLVCDPRQESHHHAKRHATYTANKRGV